MVAVESGLFMFPINILIITIFRHIKPRLIDNKEESNIIKNKAVIPASVSMNTIIQVQQFFCNITFTLSCKQNGKLLKVRVVSRPQEIMDLLVCLSKNPKNMLSKDLGSESSGDLFWALNKVHDLIERMTGSLITTEISPYLKKCT